MPPDGDVAAAPMDFRRLGAARTAEVLAFADRVLAGELKVAMGVLRRVPRGGAVLDRDDLRAEGQIAALEAAVTFDASKGSGTWQTRVRAMIQWRLRDVVRKVVSNTQREQSLPAQRDETVMMTASGGLPADRMWQVHDPIDESAVSVEDQLAERQAMQFIEQNAAALLTRREQVIISARMSGVEGTDRELAAMFGVDRSRVTRSMASAMEKFSRAFERGRRVKSCA